MATVVPITSPRPVQPPIADDREAKFALSRTPPGLWVVREHPKDGTWRVYAVSPGDADDILVAITDEEDVARLIAYVPDRFGRFGRRHFLRPTETKDS
tara:strand:+ start:1607 stop:1900 length:294 start_codon:yes stop_codon:yes gene_type:complete